MTETQFRYKTDSQAEFENFLLENEEAFQVIALVYLERADRLEDFFEWAWQERSKIKGARYARPGKD